MAALRQAENGVTVPELPEFGAFTIDPEDRL